MHILGTPPCLLSSQPHPRPPCKPGPPSHLTPLLPHKVWITCRCDCKSHLYPLKQAAVDSERCWLRMRGSLNAAQRKGGEGRGCKITKTLGSVYEKNFCARHWLHLAQYMQCLCVWITRTNNQKLARSYKFLPTIKSERCFCSLVVKCKGTLAPIS